MEKYKLVFKKSVVKDLRTTPNKDVKRILSCIESLCNNPRCDKSRAEGYIKLSGQELYRVRQGRYRIIYEIQGTELIIFVIKVAHRSDVYKTR